MGKDRGLESTESPVADEATVKTLRFRERDASTGENISLSAVEDEEERDRT